MKGNTQKSLKFQDPLISLYVFLFLISFCLLLISSLPHLSITLTTSNYFKIMWSNLLFPFCNIHTLLLYRRVCKCARIGQPVKTEQTSSSHCCQCKLTGCRQHYPFSLSLTFSLQALWCVVITYRQQPNRSLSLSANTY